MPNRDFAVPIDRSQLTPPLTATPGWDVGVTLSESFVEPTLLHRDGANPNAARIVLVSAPGAVGKSTYATRICAAIGLCKVDLAVAGPVAEHSFVGGATRALGSNAAALIKNGAVGVLIDALDEAQLRVPPESYQAFLADVAASAPPSGPPIVLFGRTEAVEDAALCLLEHLDELAVDCTPGATG